MNFAVNELASGEGIAKAEVWPPMIVRVTSEKGSRLSVVIVIES